MRHALRLAALPCLLAGGAAAQQFSYVPGALPPGTIWTNGVAFADVDLDGDVDILFANGSSYGGGGAQPQQLFLNNGNGIFSAAHANLNVANFNAQMVIAEDFDNDGDADLMYAPEGPFPATNQLPRMLINDGTGVFSDQSAARLPNITMASFCVCAGDVDNDGDLDVVFTDGATFSGVATQARLYLNDGNGFFTDATGPNLPNDTYNAQDVTLLDFDGDFDIDIAQSGKGQNGKRSRLWLNDGTGSFSPAPALNDVGGGGTYEVDFGDLDGDNDVDAMVQSISGFSEGWARNDGNFTPMPEFTFPNPNGDDDNEMAGMDYDNDGDLDVFVGSLGGSEKVYTNNGGSFSQDGAAIQSQGDSTLDIGFADLNGDGAYEMVSAQGESGNWTNKVYANLGPADTIAPLLQAVEQPFTVATPETVFRARVRDAIADDGHVGVTMTYAYTTQDGGGGTSGGGTAFHQGGGTYRAAVPTNAGTTQVSLTWTATDGAGNASQSGPVLVTPSVCAGPTTYGTGELSSLGTLAQIGSAGGLPSVTNPAFEVTLSGGKPDQGAILLESLSQASTPVIWGTLWVGAFLRHPNNTNHVGGASYTVPMSPAMIGQTVYYQWVVRDAGFGGGAQHSDGLAVTFCP